MFNPVGVLAQDHTAWVQDMGVLAYQNAIIAAAPRLARPISGDKVLTSYIIIKIIITHHHHHHIHHKNPPSSFIIITILIYNHHHPTIIIRWTTQTTSTLPACSPLS